MKSNGNSYIHLKNFQQNTSMGRDEGQSETSIRVTYVVYTHRKGRECQGICEYKIYIVVENLPQEKKKKKMEEKKKKKL